MLNINPSIRWNHNQMVIHRKKNIFIDYTERKHIKSPTSYRSNRIGSNYFCCLEYHNIAVILHVNFTITSHISHSITRYGCWVVPSSRGGESICLWILWWWTATVGQHFARGKRHAWTTLSNLPEVCVICLEPQYYRFDHQSHRRRRQRKRHAIGVACLYVFRMYVHNIRIVSVNIFMCNWWQYRKWEKKISLIAFKLNNVR